MPQAPLVYVIVLTWNGKDDTVECLASLQKLTYENARVVVVDNASTDGTAEAIRSQFPKVEVVINGANLRFAGGNNVGIRRALEASADYILLLNNDTTVDPDCLTHLVETAEKIPDMGMAGPKILYYDDPQRLWFAGGKIEWRKGWVSHVGIRELDRGQYDQEREVDYLTGCCLLIKREAIDKIGILDETYLIYGEDADWCLRAVRAGYKLLYVPRAIVWHKVSASTGGHLSWFKNWNKLKSQLRLMARYAKPYHWLTIPFWIVINVVVSYLRVKRAS